MNDEISNASWVRLATYPNRVEAEIVRTLLENHGIAAKISADDTAGLYPQLAFSSGVHLYVQLKDLKDAEEILK